jgi:hypothetical protein
MLKFLFICSLLSATNLFSQSIPDKLKLNKYGQLVIYENISSSDRYIALYLSSGIYTYNENDLILGRVVLSADISFQLGRRFYLDFKGDVFHSKKETYGGMVSILPAIGFQVFNKESLLMTGLGFSLYEDGHKGHPDLPGFLITAFSRYRYEMTKVFGVFSEIRYSVTPYKSSKTHHFFLTAGISLQAPLRPPK